MFPIGGILLTARLVLLFSFYSMVGWACETVFCSVLAKRFINRGFLNGPFCPVYGFGALVSVYLLSPLKDALPFPGNLALLYLAGVVALSALEYATGWLLETLFHAKWWDYSHHKIQIHGRVCLSNALLFGVMAVVTVYWVHPAVESLLDRAPAPLLLALAAALLLYFLSDCAVTVRSVLLLNGRLAQLQRTLDELREKTAALSAAHREELREAAAALRDQAGARCGEASQRLQQALENVQEEGLRERLRQLLEAQRSMEHAKLLQRRLLRAFPHLRTRWPESLERLRRSSRRPGRKPPKTDRPER